MKSITWLYLNFEVIELTLMSRNKQIKELVCISISEKMQCIVYNISYDYLVISTHILYNISYDYLVISTYTEAKPQNITPDQTFIALLKIASSSDRVFCRV